MQEPAVPECPEPTVDRTFQTEAPSSSYLSQSRRLQSFLRTATNIIPLNNRASDAIQGKASEYVFCNRIRTSYVMAMQVANCVEECTRRAHKALRRLTVPGGLRNATDT